MPTLNEEQRRLLMEEKQRLNDQYRRALAELREREKRQSPPAHTVVIKANSEVWWTIVKAFLITLAITSFFLSMGLAAAGLPFEEPQRPHRPPPTLSARRAAYSAVCLAGSAGSFFFFSPIFAAHKAHRHADHMARAVIIASALITLFCLSSGVYSTTLAYTWVLSHIITNTCTAIEIHFILLSLLFSSRVSSTDV